MIPVTKPYIPNEKIYFKYIKLVNKKEWLTNFGFLHQELTNRLEEYLGVKNLLLLSNGTLALQVAYKTLGFRDRVLTTPFTFVASTSSLAWEGLDPVFSDIDKGSLGLSPKLLPKKLPSNISGILAVHVYGNPADTSKLDRYGKQNNIKVIYDGAHAFGVKKNGKSILLSGDATTLSLHATKVFHTIEGGAIIFRKKEDFEIAKQLVNFGLDDNKEICRVGINAKLNEYQAAAGLVLLEEIDSIIERRVSIWSSYRNALKDYVEFPDWDSTASPNGAYAPIILKNENQLKRVSKHLADSNIQTRRYFYPSLNEVEAFGNHGECPVSEDIASRVLCLPIYTTLTKRDQGQVINKLKVIL